MDAVTGPGLLPGRINQQWRICFQWTDAGPEDVEITDYH
jgi:plasmid maintenance system killer protein